MRRPITCIAIDDEKLYLAQIEAFIKEIPELELLGAYDNPIQAATAVIKDLPDLILTDLEMPYQDGLSLMDWIQPRLKESDHVPKIIVISGKEDFDRSDIDGSIVKSSIRSPEDLRSNILSILAE